MSKENKKPMDANVKATIIRCISAVLCVAIVICGSSVISNKANENKLQIAQSVNGGNAAADNGSTDSADPASDGPEPISTTGAAGPASGGTTSTATPTGPVSSGASAKAGKPPQRSSMQTRRRTDILFPIAFISNQLFLSGETSPDTGLFPAHDGSRTRRTQFRRGRKTDNITFIQYTYSTLFLQEKNLLGFPESRKTSAAASTGQICPD